jgi:hypothetical protein
LIWLEDESEGIPLAGTTSINFMTVSLTLPSSTTSDYSTSGWYKGKHLIWLED